MRREYYQIKMLQSFSGEMVKDPTIIYSIGLHKNDRWPRGVRKKFNNLIIGTRKRFYEPPAVFSEQTIKRYIASHFPVEVNQIDVNCYAAGDVLIEVPDRLNCDSVYSKLETIRPASCTISVIHKSGGTNER